MKHVLTAVVSLSGLLVISQGYAAGFSDVLPGMKAIFLDKGGIDSRVPMTNSQYPWSAIGRVTLDMGDGTTSVCTGTLVGRKVMVTNAHCVLKGGKPSQVTFQASYNDGKFAATSSSNWVTVGTLDPETDRSADWAVVQLLDPLGDTQGWLGMQVLDDVVLPLKVLYAGYSNNFRDSEVAGVDGCTVRTRLEDGTFGHNCSTGSGGSGGPLFATFENDKTRVVALNSRGVQNGVYLDYTPEVSNKAVMTSALMKTVIEYKEKFDK